MIELAEELEPHDETAELGPVSTCGIWLSVRHGIGPIVAQKTQGK